MIYEQLKNRRIYVLNIASIKYELYLFVLNLLIKLIYHKKNLFFLSILSLLLTNFSQVKNINIETKSEKTQQVKSQKEERSRLNFKKNNRSNK